MPLVGLGGMDARRRSGAGVVEHGMHRLPEETEGGTIGAGQVEVVSRRPCGIKLKAVPAVLD